MTGENPNGLPALIEILEMAPERRAAILDSADWDDLMRTAMRHQVLPLLHARVERHPAGGRLKDSVLSNAARSLQRADDMMRLVNALAGAGVPTLSFRGPVLAQLLYGDPAMRQFADVDLLVRRADAARAMQVLAEEGLQPMFRLDDRQEEALIEYQTERFFLREADRLCVDLHWQILPEPFLFEREEDALWGRSRRIAFQGVEVGVLSDDDLLLFLCAHGAKHGWSRLNLLCDLKAWAVAHPDAEWSRILGLADKAGKRLLVLTALRLVNLILGFPAPVRSSVAAERAALAAKHYLFRNRPNDEEKGKQRAVQALCLPRLADRLRLRWDPVFSVTGLDIEKASLPRPLFFLYRLIRLARLAVKYSSRAVT